MISTIERDFIVKDGVATFSMKELPDWFGISDIEDSMWDRWIRDDDGKLIDGRENDDDGFEKFMLDNKDEVYELIELAMESED